jgi:hypothetical protein
MRREKKFIAQEESGGWWYGNRTRAQKIIDLTKTLGLQRMPWHYSLSVITEPKDRGCKEMDIFMHGWFLDSMDLSGLVGPIAGEVDDDVA